MSNLRTAPLHLTVEVSARGGEFVSSNKSILCVSESGDTCFLISNLLRQSDYRVVTACCAWDAPRLIRAARFDLHVLGKRYNDQSTAELT